ncbi:MAG: hypothetical protein KDD60_01610 [Bdellovibrionales bacterium]|nr:hypothetical protein [Bdellovibrionales bacterium]
MTKNVTPKKLEEFLLKALPSYEEHLYLLLRSSFAQQIDPILDKIIEDHAEAFNSSYSHDGSGQITIEDENKFLDHGKAALEYIRQAADGDSTLPPTGFIKNAIVFSLFDRTVLSALRSRLGDGYAD